MKLLTRLGGLLVLLGLCATPSGADAHPLGNFTVNHYSRLEPAGDDVQVVYVLDLAEIPAFQEQWRIDADGNGAISDAEREQYADLRAAELGQNLRLTLNGEPAALRVVSRALSFPPGQGGLVTLRLDVVYAAPLPSGATGRVELTYRDDSDPGRIGWREVVARPGTPSTQLLQASVPATDLTSELRVYPEDLLNSLPNVREAQLVFLPGVGGASLPRSIEPRVAQPAHNAYAALAAAEDLSWPVILFSLAAALVLGALHALSPGHGKTVVAAYLVGSGGTARQAFFLGATMTATHTIGVYVLGLVTLYLSQYVLPERLYPALQLVSGLLIVGLGVGLFGSRLRTALGRRGRERSIFTHHHGGQSHTHLPGTSHQAVTGRSLLALGISGGLLPCPSALVVLLSAIALHRVGFGLLLVVAFSVGLAGVLVGIGLVLVYAGRGLRRVPIGGSRIAQLLPVASPVVIVAAGLAITVQALAQVP